MQGSHFVKALVTGLIAAFGLAASAATTAQTITVNAATGQRAIDPRIYGVSMATPAMLADLNCPLNRFGGDDRSTYNYSLNAANKASDYYFESWPDNQSYSGWLTGNSDDAFIAGAKAAGAQAMLTIPMIGWAAILTTPTVNNPNGLLWSFDTVKYAGQGTQQAWSGMVGWDTSQAGANGGFAGSGGLVIASSGFPSQFVLNNPTDAYTMADKYQAGWSTYVPGSATTPQVDCSFQQPWVAHLIGSWGAAAAGGLRYYTLDNEPDLWSSTHADIHSSGPTATEISAKMIAYAQMIKAADPGALVVGPELSGWLGYFYSAYDEQYGNGAASWPYGSYPNQAGGSYSDQIATYGTNYYLPWLLNQISAAGSGTRLLDVCTVHWYPGGNLADPGVTNATAEYEFPYDGAAPTDDAVVQALRNRSTRSLWDPAYPDESWISTTGANPAYPHLIPQLQAWAAANSPGTQVGITEYNWGDDPNINGATAQADVLGIFGAYGLNLATRWEYPSSDGWGPSALTYQAFKIYRNYDGNKSTFGNASVSTTVTNPDYLSALSAIRCITPTRSSNRAAHTYSRPGANTW